jgi:hypothetical protein
MLLYAPGSMDVFFQTANQEASAACFDTAAPGGRPSKSWTPEGEKTGEPSWPSRPPSSALLACHFGSALSCLKKDIHAPSIKSRLSGPLLCIYEARPPRPETETGSGGAKFLEYRTMAILFLCLAIQTHVLQASLGQGHTKKRHLHALFHI